MRRAGTQSAVFLLLINEEVWPPRENQFCAGKRHTPQGIEMLVPVIGAPGILQFVEALENDDCFAGANEVVDLLGIDTIPSTPSGKEHLVVGFSARVLPTKLYK